MTTINDLNKSISSMTDEELMERLLKLRKTRRTAEVKNIKRKNITKATVKRTAISLLKHISLEDMQKIMEEGLND